MAKLIQSLERELGLTLFERSAHGLSLTAGGAGYLEACRPALAQLADADEQASAAVSRVSGTVVVGVQMLDLSTKTLFLFTVALVVVWMLAALVIVREHRRATAAGVPVG